MATRGSLKCLDAQEEEHLAGRVFRYSGGEQSPVMRWRWREREGYDIGITALIDGLLGGGARWFPVNEAHTMVLAMLGKIIPTVTACLAIAPIATATDSPPTGQPVPPRDSFHGRITSATGKLKSDRDRVAIELRRTTRGDPQAVTITLSGRRCHHRRRCSRIAGTLRGTMIPRASPPDSGEQFALSLKGKVRPLGHVTARGTAHGTGFVSYAYESLHLTLAGMSASITIDAQSGRVPGFTSP